MKDSKITEAMGREFVGEAGGGMVKVVVKGTVIAKIEIDKSIFANSTPELLDDLDFLSDLFKSATNQAMDRANQYLSNTLLEPMIGLNDLR